MARIKRVWLLPAFLLACFFLYVYRGPDVPSAIPSNQGTGNPNNIHWVKHDEHYPVESFIPLPSWPVEKTTKIQHEFDPETESARKTRLERRAAVLESFHHAWDGYKRYAWGKDEVSPISGHYRNSYGGWGATLVDTMDTLWIMGMKEDFEACVKAVENIDFTTNTERAISVFETTIRYLGGLMAAYELSEGKYPVLLKKSVELGDMLYSAFDTPNRMPMTRWDWQKSASGEPIEAGEVALIAEIGSLSLEFTRLSQLTKDSKYFDAIQRISNRLESAQSKTKIPGLWPIVINAKDLTFDFNMFTFSGMADSTYEYLPKQHLLLGGRIPQYKDMYEAALSAAKKYLFFRPAVPSDKPLLFSGNARADDNGNPVLDPQAQHLACFIGGMVGLGSRIFDQPEDMPLARELTEGCIWAYSALPTGLMPEVCHLIPCHIGIPDPSTEDQPRECTWSETLWHDAIISYNKPADLTTNPDDLNATFFITQDSLPPGFTAIDDTRYHLRPEAMESLFILYRLTGDIYYADAAWKMFQTIVSVTRTPIANAAVKDVRKIVSQGSSSRADAAAIVAEGLLNDRMESFWLAETLKYAYLIFEDSNVLSLDEWVLNTEAHPFRLGWKG